MAEMPLMDAPGVLLLTDDTALAFLIATEAAELSLPLRTVGELTPEGLAVASAVILDLDARGGMQAALHPDAPVAVGICRSLSALPTIVRARVPHVLERPFATADMRRLLLQLRQGAPVRSELPQAPALSGLHRAIWMEQDTTVCVGDIRVSLTPKEALLMRCLVERRGEVVSIETLNALMACDGARSNEAQVYMCHLRRKLETPTGLKLISTVRGVGYCLMGHEI